MKRKLSPWCKAVKIAMIQKDWGVADLAQAVKMTKEYTSAVINGRVISEPAVKVISVAMNMVYSTGAAAGLLFVLIKSQKSP